MTILILGGTQFVGRHIAQTLFDAGHRVTLFNRGKSRDDLPQQIERLKGDRDAGVSGLDSLSSRSWDACIDVSGYTPRQVRPIAEKLRHHIHRYIFISAVSVYGNPQDRPILETHLRLSSAPEDITEINGDTYGPLKVTCENIVEQIYPSRSTILRPQIVVGPHDPYDRYSYWIRRSTQPGPVLAPGDGSDHVQFIDARDLARFVQNVGEKDISDGFNLAGPRLTWKQFMQILGINNPVWVPAEILQRAGITESELPLYRPENSPPASRMHIDNSRALATGLTLTDPQTTAEYTRAWIHNCKLPPALSHEREQELIHLAAQSAPKSR